MASVGSKMFRIFLPFLCALSVCSVRATEFTVVAYNVENFFDVDGVAIFDDYQQDYPEDPLGYSRAKLLTKLENAVSVLAAIGDGVGPDVILFQEFENDFTSDSLVTDFDMFLDQYGDTSVEKMLGAEWKPDYSGVPAVAWMLKTMADSGLVGYEVAVGPTKKIETRLAHVNATFSRFPIREVNAYPIREARDILEVAIEVDGETLWLYNNHWKSGASNPDREPVRVKNARVLRDLVNTRLELDPSADIIIGGDLNAHYNQSLLFPDIQTGINDVLGSQGNERFEAGDLYNLWFELPVEERYTEVWRGNRGTLMHLIVSRGLYDDEGISYVDSSYDKHIVPDFNVDALGRPLEWSFAGERGAGVSDHLPVVARFSTEPFAQLGEFSEGDDAPDFEIPLGYVKGMDLEVPSGEFLNDLADEELSVYVDKLFEVEARVVGLSPVRLLMDSSPWVAYVPDPSVFKEIRGLLDAGEARFLVRPGFWRGEKQFVIDGVIEP